MIRKFLFILGIFLLVGLAPAGWAAKVDINKADAAALQQNLHGIGPVKARAIIDYRRKHGPFRKIEDLMNVPGIGEATLRKNRRELSLSGGITRGGGKAASTTRHARSPASSRRTGASTAPKPAQARRLRPFEPVKTAKVEKKIKKKSKKKSKTKKARTESKNTRSRKEKK